MPNVATTVSFILDGLAAGEPVAVAVPEPRLRLGQARAFAVGHASRLALPSERLEDVARAVGELATNSIRHGGGSGVLRIWAGRRPCRVRGA